MELALPTRADSHIPRARQSPALIPKTRCRAAGSVISRPELTRSSAPLRCQASQPGSGVAPTYSGSASCLPASGRSENKYVPGARVQTQHVDVASRPSRSRRISSTASTGVSRRMLHTGPAGSRPLRLKIDTARPFVNPTVNDGRHSPVLAFRALRRSPSSLRLVTTSPATSSLRCGRLLLARLHPQNRDSRPVVSQEAVGERIAANQTDHRPGIARTELRAAGPAGHQPAIDAGAGDPHGTAAVQPDLQPTNVSYIVATSSDGRSKQDCVSSTFSWKLVTLMIPSSMN